MFSKSHMFLPCIYQTCIRKKIGERLEVSSTAEGPRLNPWNKQVMLEKNSGEP